MEDIKECKSILRMNEFYFSEMTFKVTKLEKQEIKILIGVKFRKENDNQVVILSVNASSDDESVTFAVELIGKFELVDGEKLPEEIKEKLLTENTVSMMMPYMRSQVSLLTTQPGLKPILLDPVNISEFVQDEIKNGAKEY